VYAAPARRIDEVLQRCGSEVRIDDVTGLVVQVSDPFGELSRVRYRRRQKNEVDVVGQQDQGLLPDHSAFLVSHVVDLVEDDPADFSHHFRPSVQHVTQDLQKFR
jgi:hypothetical protein